MKRPHQLTWALVLLAAVASSVNVYGLEHGHPRSYGAEGVFLRSEAYRSKPGTEQELRLVNGAYSKSEKATPRERIHNVTILSNGKKVLAPEANWRDGLDASFLKFHAREPGTHAIGVSIAQNAGKPSSWHARAIVQVGEPLTDDYARPLGHPIEILLEKNPAATPFGQDMSFRVLYKDKPLAGQEVAVGYDGYHEHNENGGHLDWLTLHTDAEGRARFNLELNTPWYISLVYQDKAGESIGASLTFDTR